MQITVRVFAALRETIGTPALQLDVPVGATVADAWQALVQIYPILHHSSSLSYALNRSYADRATTLSDGDELALIPPVSGG